MGVEVLFNAPIVVQTLPSVGSPTNTYCMRVPRKHILPPESIFHFMWRCINSELMLQPVFYNDWNPVMAGICQHPADYRFSSYRFYAFGDALCVLLRPERVLGNQGSPATT